MHSEIPIQGMIERCHIVGYYSFRKLKWIFNCLKLICIAQFKEIIFLYILVITSVHRYTSWLSLFLSLFRVDLRYTELWLYLHFVFVPIQRVSVVARAQSRNSKTRNWWRENPVPFLAKTGFSTPFPSGRHGDARKRDPIPVFFLFCYFHILCDYTTRELFERARARCFFSRSSVIDWDHFIFASFNRFHLFLINALIDSFGVNVLGPRAGDGLIGP